MSKAWYPMHCAECGSEVGNKFFSMNNVLEQYGFENISAVWNVGALFGEEVLPGVPPLLANGGIQKPDFAKLGKKTLPIFTKEVQQDQLGKVSLNIASIVAQFFRKTGFQEIYDMLDVALSGKTSAEFQADCYRFMQLPDVKLSDDPAMMAANLPLVYQFLTDILAHAQAGKRYALWTGWLSQEKNGRAMPKKLVIFDSNGRDMSVDICCCDKCLRPLPYEFGAYWQRIIGVLGTQQVGKTSYLMALTDAIENNELTAITGPKGETKSVGIAVKPVGDEQQWTHVNAAGEGALWMYQNGFPVEKTAVSVKEAPALTWLIRDEENLREPILYTLADIPGEAFAEPEKFPAKLIERVTRLLRASDSMIVVINSLQTGDGWTNAPKFAARKAGIAAKADKILSCLQVFRGQDPSFAFKGGMPTAVVLSAADLIEDGKLRKAFHLAYDLKDLSPLMWREEETYLAYNTEAVTNAIQAVRGHIDASFSNFMTNLKLDLWGEKEQAVNLAAFAVSSGTQFATTAYADATEEEKSRGFTERYEQMREARFGVTGPLLWLLARDERVALGKAGITFAAPAAEKLADEKMRKCLYD